MRPIKFRAWDKDAKRMYHLFMSVWVGDDLPDGQIESQDVFEWPEIYEVMQFTGLHDKDGKEIYEGDYVKGTRFVDSPDYEEREGWVEFLVTEGAFVMRDSTCRRPEEYIRMLVDFEADGWEKYEVIGNIYENPDLLGTEGER